MGIRIETIRVFICVNKLFLIDCYLTGFGFFRLIFIFYPHSSRSPRRTNASSMKNVESERRAELANRNEGMHCGYLVCLMNSFDRLSDLPHCSADAWQRLATRSDQIVCLLFGNQQSVQLTQLIVVHHSSSF